MPNLMDHLFLDAFALLVFGLVAVLVVGVGYWFIDYLLKRVDLQAEVTKGNLSAGIFSSAIVLSIAVVVAVALNGVLR